MGVNMSYLDILIELVMGYIALFITVKCLGRTQISQITPFDFISSLVLGDLVGSAIFDAKAGLLKILFAILVWGALIFLTEIATQKSFTLRYIFEGKPSVIIKKGELVWKEMKKNRLDLDQLRQLLRAKDVFSLDEVEYAIFENNGGLSVLKKADSDQPTCKDLNITRENRTIPITIISDGKVLEKNLRKAGVDHNWLNKQLQEKGVKQPKEICYAEWEAGKPLYIQKYKS
jgi:uncharacterized membrane protein YcaP (DUF421 family)